MVQRASMDFFGHQAAARKKTTLLILYYLLAVAFIIIGVHIAVVLALHISGHPANSFLDPQIFSGAAAGVLFIVLIGSIYKVIALSKGGRSVAEMLGGTHVIPNTNDPNERRLLNVVEEMAIASGVPVPGVYILQDEPGINAFAAGLSTRDAVVAVTRGSMTRLTRDELQGVVAHEFSHILNGDMRLNVRLIGVVNGILIIAILGRILLRALSSNRPRSTDRKKGSSLAAVMVLGLVLMIVGYIGVFFGRLIKSAVSRQREFLADASAVQFTRNPSGILGALKKIAGVRDGSLIRNAHAEEASHLFFGNGLKKSMIRALSSHPPIQERIRRIDPLVGELRAAGKAPSADAISESSPWMVSLADRKETGAKERKMKPSPDWLVSAVGSPQPAHVDFARKLISRLPQLIAEAVREPLGAKAVLYGLLLNAEGEVRANQLSTLEKHAEPSVLEQVGKLSTIVDTLGMEFRLPTMDMAMPALRSMSGNQYLEFRTNLRMLAEADHRITLFEYTLQRAVMRSLDSFFGMGKPPRIKYHVLEQIQLEATELLSALAWEGSRESSGAEEAFQKGLEALGDGTLRLRILPKEKCDLKMLISGLGRISEASFSLRKQILRACEYVVHADVHITLEETELLRAVADSLDCPVPPLFPFPEDSPETQEEPAGAGSALRTRMNIER